jgi:hypothetical protein
MVIRDQRRALLINAAPPRDLRVGYVQHLQT